MAILLTVPQNTIPAGPGSFVTSVIASNAKEFVVRFQQFAWPHAGDKALDYTMEVALDGVNFVPLCYGDVTDASVPARGAKALDAFAMTVGPIPGIGLTTRKLRISWVFAKALSVSGSLEAN